jgi:hypothetical protein
LADSVALQALGEFGDAVLQPLDPQRERLERRNGVRRVLGAERACGRRLGGNGLDRSAEQMCIT